MSLLDLSKATVNVSVYYQIKNTKSGKRVIVLPDKKAEEMLQDEDEKNNVEILNTTWKMLSWSESNKILDKSTVVQPQYDSIAQESATRDLNVYLFRDLRIKTALKGWDLKDDSGKDVPYRPELVDILPPEIVMAMYFKYDEVSSLDEVEEKN